MTDLSDKVAAFFICAGTAGLLLAHPTLYPREIVHQLSVVAALCLLVTTAVVSRGSLALSRPTWIAAGVLAAASVAAFARAPAAGENLVVLFAPFLFLAAGVTLGGRRALPGVLLVCTAGAAATAAVYGLLQFAGWDFIPWGTRFGGRRIVSFFENPNYYANFTAAALPLCLAAFASARGVRPHMVWGTLACASYAGLLIAGSRGAWWGAAAGGLVVAAGIARQRRLDRVRLRWSAMIGLALALIAITLVIRQQPLMPGPDGPVFIGERLASSGNIVGAGGETDRSINHRYLIWRVTWRMIAERPILGLGMGMYADGFVKARELMQVEGAFPTAGWDAYFDVHFAHNEYLHIWCERGFVGLFGFVLLVVAVVYGAGRAIWEATGERLEAIGFMGLATVMLVHGMVSYPLQLPLNGTLFWVVLGILANRAYLEDSVIRQGGGQA